MPRNKALTELRSAFSPSLETEKHAQTVLEKYWWLLLIPYDRGPRCEHAVYAQEPMGIGDKEYVPDFLAIYNVNTFTTESIWTFIELEPPGIRLLNKDGGLALRLRKAYEQILDWNEWLSSHPEVIRDVFWSWGQIRFKYRIFASRRSLAGDAEWRRIPSLVRANRFIDLSIHTYDNIIETAESIDDVTWQLFEQSSIHIFRLSDFRRKTAFVCNQETGVLQIVRHAQD